MLKNLLPMMIALLVMSINTWDFMQFGVEQKNYKKVIEKAETNSRIFKIVYQSTSAAGRFYLPVYDHFPSWHFLRGTGMVDFNFGGYGGLPVTYKNTGMVMRPRYGFDWSVHNGDCYDYFISRAGVDPFFTPDGKLSKYRHKVELIVASGKWFLYKNRNPKVCN
jgi:hypothetical protein